MEINNSVHKIIKSVFAIVRKRRQIIGFHVEDFDKIIYLSSRSVRAKMNIHITEIEILINSTIRFVFYKRNEKMLDGRICSLENCVIKDFWITTSDSIDEMREKNKALLLRFKTIKKVFQFVAKSGEEIIGIDTGGEKAIFTKTKIIRNSLQLHPLEFDLLIGSYICPIYYNEGETLNDGTIIKKSGAIIKTLNLRLSSDIDRIFKDVKKNATNYEDVDSNDDFKDDDDANSPTYKEKETYENYESSWAQGIEGLSDQFIRDVLGGEPDAYWNID